MESFKDLRAFPRVDSQQSERQFTDLLKHIYSRHRNVVPVMAMGVAELKKELSDEVRAWQMLHPMCDTAMSVVDAAHMSCWRILPYPCFRALCFTDPDCTLCPQ